MADIRLQALRRAAAAGDVEAQARELLERVRAGTLTRDRLELAAYCGHEGALVVTPRPKGAPSDCGLCHGHPDGILSHATDGPAWTRIPCAHELEAWVRGLERWGPPAQIRAMRAASGVTTDIYTSRGRINGYALRLEGLVDELLIAPSLELRDEAALLHDVMAETPARVGPWLFLASAVATLSPKHLDSDTRLCVRQAARVAMDEQRVREAIERGLIAWALGPAPTAARSLGRCFAGSCSTPAVRYANGHAMCEQHAADYEARLASLRAPHIDADPELPPTPAVELAETTSTPLSQPQGGPDA